MRNTINIIKYGFFLFLIVAGILSIFMKNEQFLVSINNLAIPIFLFSLSLLLVKWNKIVRDEVNKQLHERDAKQARKNRTCEELEQKINTENFDYKTRNEMYKQLNELMNESLLSEMETIYLFKFFKIIDVFTIILNILAMMSFCFCLLVMTGIFVFTQNLMFINLFSLALVFFDFYILEELVRHRFEKRMLAIQRKAEKKLSKICIMTNKSEFKIHKYIKRSSSFLYNK